jgi:hypothetical protein
MKHIKLFEQFVNEKKEVYTVYVEDDREPGGTDKEIKKDYNLEVFNRTKDGFDLVGAKKDIEDFVEDYSIIGDIELYEGQVNEGVRFNSIKFNSHENHNPSCDIIEGHLDKDSYITYGIYIKDAGSRKAGDEFMEYYTGSNYKVGSTKPSHSRVYTTDKIPAKYKAAWEELKAKYEAEYK